MFFLSVISINFIEITDSTKVDYFNTHRPHTTKIHTLLKALGLKRHPVQDAQ